MDISKSGDRPAQPGPTDWFTGKVSILPLFAAEDPSRMSGNQVTFQPGARTHWHTHPMGQIIVITEGICRVQREGGPVETAEPGDVVRFAPNERHWHGAGPDVAMTHIALQEGVDGVAVVWGEPVRDADCGAT